MPEDAGSKTKDLILRASTSQSLAPITSKALQRPAVLRLIDEALEDSYSVEDADELLLLTLMPDDSGSMAGELSLAVIAGHNDLLAALRDENQSDDILVQTRYLNGTVLNPFSPPSACSELNTENYSCDQGTPLFEQTLVTLGAALVKAQESLEAGSRKVRTATLIMSDAQSTDANKRLMGEVRALVEDMAGYGHIVAGMGFGHTESFTRVFRKMGIKEELIFSAGSRTEILEKFRTFREAALAAISATKEQRS